MGEILAVVFYSFRGAVLRLGVLVLSVSWMVVFSFSVLRRGTCSGWVVVTRFMAPVLSLGSALPKN